MLIVAAIIGIWFASSLGLVAFACLLDRRHMREQRAAAHGRKEGPDA